MWGTLLEKNFDHISRFGENRQKLQDAPVLDDQVTMEKH